MAAGSTDSQLDKDLKKRQTELSQLQVRIQSFTNTFRDMKPKERADSLNYIKRTFDSVQNFINGINVGLVTNTGTRFKIDAVKNKVQSLKARWRKVERELEKY